MVKVVAVLFLTVAFVFFGFRLYTQFVAAAASSATFQIKASSDDANEDGNTFNYNSKTLWIGNGNSATNSYLGLHFMGTTIPKGAIITSARLDLKSSKKQLVTISSLIAGELSPNSSTFSSSNPPSKRVLTTNKVAYSATIQWNTNTWYSLTDISPIVQEIINQQSWQTGNSLSLIIQGTGASGKRDYVYSRNNGSNNAPKLVITYTLPDTQAPTVPTNLSATPISPTQIDLSWTASTDNEGVTGYNIVRNEVTIATSTSTAYSDTNLSPGTYSYQVSAFDVAGNTSALSTPIDMPTLDDQPPTAPADLSATSISPTEVDLSWTASNDNLAVLGYNILRDGVKIGTSNIPSYPDNSVWGNTTYAYQVSAFDVAGNTSALSSTASATTPTPITYRTCQNNACVIVGGTGTDSCSVDTDCAPPPPPPPPPGNVKVLCDGQSFSNWGSIAPITIGDNPDDTNPDIQKIIRNCTFVNPVGVASYQAAVRIKQGNNILIENSRFENIRTLIPDDGVFAISMGGANPIDNVVIRGNFFKDIGADAIQPGPNGPEIRNIKIENNEFVGSEEVGENAVDIKGVYGPIYVTNNKMHGFRPCQSSKTNPPGTQDCTGSNGPAIVIHTGSTGFVPTDIYVTGNDIYDSTIGFNMSNGNHVLFQNNLVYDNLEYGVNYSGGDLTLSGNTYTNNPTNCLGISPCQ